MIFRCDESLKRCNRLIHERPFSAVAPGDTANVLDGTTKVSGYCSCLLQEKVINLV
jgi:hypothetical protein